MLCFLNDYDLLLPDQIHYRIVSIFSHILKLIFQQHFLPNFCNQLLLQFITKWSQTKMHNYYGHTYTVCMWHLLMVIMKNIP